MIKEQIKTRWGVVASMLFIPLVLIDVIGFSSKIGIVPISIIGLPLEINIYWEALLALFSVEVLLMIYAIRKEQTKIKWGIISRIATLLSMLLLLGFVAFSLDMSWKVVQIFLSMLSVGVLFMVLPLGCFEIALGVTSVVMLIGFYAYLSHEQHVKNPRDTTMPGFAQMKEGVKKITEINKKSGKIWIVVDSKATGTRLFLGLLYGVLGSIVLGLLMGCYRDFEAFFVPPLSFLAKCPPTAMLAVFFVLVGTGENMFITMIAFGVLPSLAQSIYLAAKDVPDELLFKAYTIGASNAEAIWCIVYKHILPKMIDAIRLQIGSAIVYLIAAEILCADPGFGYRMRIYFQKSLLNIVYLYIVLLAGFGFAIDYTLRYLQRICCPWYTKERG